MLQRVASKYRALLTPLIVFWFVSTSSLICALTMFGDSNTPSFQSLVESGTFMQGRAIPDHATKTAKHHDDMSFFDSLTAKKHQAMPDYAEAHCHDVVQQLDDSTSQNGFYCCDNIESPALSGLGMIQLDVPLLFIVVLLLSSQVTISINHQQYSTRFDYRSPPIPILNCVYLK